MADVNLSYKNADTYGRASFEVLDRYVQEFLLAGAEPALQPAMGVFLADSLTLPQFAVVGLNGSNKLVMATASIKALGVLVHAATSGASNVTVRGQVWYSGCFNLNGPLIWDSTLNTDALKHAAFLGSPTPTQIVLRSRLTPAV